MDHRLIEALMTGVAPIIKSYVTQATEPLLARIAELEAREPVNGAKGDAGQDGTPGRDGLSITADDVRPMLEEMVAAIPRPENGKDADPAEIAALVGDEVAKAVAAIPLPKDGLDGKDGIDGADGISITVDDVTPLIESEVEKTVALIPPAKDGEDGSPGRDGRDGLPGVPGTPGEKGIDGRDGINGTDGLGFDDLTVEYDDERTVTLRFVQGDRVKEFPLTLPVILDRGVWRERAGGFQKADGVSYGGSFWIAQRDTSSKPDTADSGWRLAIKRGRDGKDARPMIEPKPVALK